MANPLDERRIPVPVLALTRSLLRFALSRNPVVLLGCIAALVLFSRQLSASTPEVEASIDEAINNHYLNIDFEKAEQVLSDAIGNCDSDCSNEVVGNAWMYIGVIRGAGKNDLVGAREAFDQAVATDPEVKIDTDLANAELVAIFEAAKSNVSEETEPEEIAEAATLSCTPDTKTIQTYRPVPIACQTEANGSEAILFFKKYGSADWIKIQMARHGEFWHGQIPCSVTEIEGTLRYYVEVRSDDGETVASLGDSTAPNRIGVEENTDEAPPSYPGESAPARCQEDKVCPSNLLGTPACPGTSKPPSVEKQWGAACKESSECESGFSCINNSCEPASYCISDDECLVGSCVDNSCTEGDATDSASAGPQNILGVSFGVDLSLVSGSATCLPGSDFLCYLQSEPFVSSVDPQAADYESAQAGAFRSTAAQGTLRVKVSYERLITDDFSIGAKAGLGFRSSPSTKVFDLFHAELFGKYWFMGATEGFRLYATVGGGIGQVEAFQQVIVQETDGTPAYESFCQDAGTPKCNISPVNTYRKLGTSFAQAGFGAFYNLGGHGPGIELLAKFTFPESAFVLEPNGGYFVAF